MTSHQTNSNNGLFKMENVIVNANATSSRSHNIHIITSLTHSLTNRYSDSANFLKTLRYKAFCVQEKYAFVLVCLAQRKKGVMQCFFECLVHSLVVVRISVPTALARSETNLKCPLIKHHWLRVVRSVFFG